MYTDGRCFGGAYDGEGPAVVDIGLDGAAVSGLREQPPAEGERRLLLVILEDAIRGYQKYAFSGTRRGRRLFRELETWFAGDPEATVSFEYICDVFDIDPGYVRNALTRWRARHFTAVRGAAAGARPYTGEPSQSPAGMVEVLVAAAPGQPRRSQPRLVAVG